MSLIASHFHRVQCWICRRDPGGKLICESCESKYKKEPTMKQEESGREFSESPRSIEGR